MCGCNVLLGSNQALAAFLLVFLFFFSGCTAVFDNLCLQSGLANPSFVWAPVQSNKKQDRGWAMTEASETRRPSVKRTREGEKPRFGLGSVTREGEIKVHHSHFIIKALALAITVICNSNSACLCALPLYT